MKFEKTLVIYIGRECNNNCLICSVENRINQQCSCSEIINDIKQGAIEGFSAIEFTGGEPTINKNLIKYIKAAKKSGYSVIALSSNGRMFSQNKFCDQVAESGLNRVTFSLHGSRKQIHDAITRAPCSFYETMKGIKNLQKNNNIYINVSTVLNKINIKDLINLAKLLKKNKIKHWNILDLIPEGQAEKNYSILKVDYNLLTDQFGKLNNIFKKFEQINFFDFPFCIFDQNFLQQKKLKIINAKDRLETTEQVGDNQSRLIEIDGISCDAYKVYVEKCLECDYQGKCAGFWKKAIKI